MLYAFFGTDVVKAREKAHALLHTLEAKGAEVVRVTPENWSIGVLLEHAGAASLFGEQSVVLIDTPSEDKEMFERVFDDLKMLGESENTFVLIEAGLLAAQKKKLEKHAEKCEEYVAAKTEKFNAFSLAEALLRRDKKSLWMLLTRAGREGLSAEEIVGVLFWQIKTLQLAGKAKSAAEAGVKPFVWSKATRALAKFKEGEVDRLSKDLVTLYHDGHTGRTDIDLALERFVLTL